MRVLHIVEAFNSGILTCLQAIVNGLDEDFQCFILYARREATPENVDALFKKGTVLIESKALTRELNPKRDMQALLEVRKIVAEIEPDVVHLHSSKAGVIGRWALNGRKVPIHYTPHGYSFLMENCSPLKKKLYYFFEKISGYRVSTTIACGKSEYEYARQVSKKAAYISNGIVTDEIDALNLDVERKNGISVCTLARISWQKNPAMFNKIAEAFPDIRFTWIGDGDLRDQLTSPNIEITGWLPKNHALVKMMESDIFLLPSLWEGLPISVLEAMYLKRLCIVSKIPGNVDVIADEKTGYVCETLEDYAKVINHISDTGTDEQMLNAARARVEQEFSQKVMVERYMAVYRAADPAGVAVNEEQQLY